MQRSCTAGLAIALALLVTAFPTQAEDESADDVVGRVGTFSITREEVLRDLGFPDEIDPGDFAVALRHRAWLHAAVHLAGEARLSITNELVTRTARDELARRVQRHAEESGRTCEVGDILARRRQSRSGFEDECRRQLLLTTLGLYELGGRRALEDDWRPAFPPDAARRLYEHLCANMPGQMGTFDDERARIETLLDKGLRKGAVAARLLELAREPDFIAPRTLARAVEAHAREVLHELERFVAASKCEAPPLPDVVLTSFDAALEEAAASGCLLYLHVDPTPEDAERVVADATLERLATRYVVAVVSGRVGERAADRLRLRYGLMRPGAMSLAIAPSGTLVDRDVPFDAERAWAAMQAAERAAASAIDEGAVPLCAQHGDEPLVQILLDPVPAQLGMPLTLSVFATNDTAGPIEQMRATVLLQGPRGGPRLVVLTLGSKHTEPGYREMATYELKPAEPGWLHLLAIIEGGAELHRAARVRAYVR